MKSGLKKWLGIGTGTLVGLTGLVGVMHMPFAKPLLMKMSGCPIVRATPAQLEQAGEAAAARNSALATTIAPARPALGFELEKTTPDDVHAWIKAKSLSCKDDFDGNVIDCTDVSSATIGETGPDVTQLEFTFHATTKTLRLVSTFRHHLTRDDAVTLMGSLEGGLETKLGAPVVHGSPTLDNAPMRGYVVSYNFKDYSVQEAANDLGPAGFGISEHYVSQRD